MSATEIRTDVDAIVELEETVARLERRRELIASSGIGGSLERAALMTLDYDLASAELALAVLRERDHPVVMNEDYDAELVVASRLLDNLRQQGASMPSERPRLALVTTSAPCCADCAEHNAQGCPGGASPYCLDDPAAAAAGELRRIVGEIRTAGLNAVSRAYNAEPSGVGDGHRSSQVIAAATLDAVLAVEELARLVAPVAMNDEAPC